MSSISIAGDTSGSVVLQAPAVAGTTTLTLPAATGTLLTSTGNQTTSGTFVMSSAYTMRNKIINGAMVIDQRNAGASVTPTNGAYTLDRWQNYVSQSSKFSVQQVSDGPSGFQKSLKVTSLSAYTVLSSDFFTVEQVIEGFNTADLAYGSSSAVTTTLSFWVKSSLTGTFGGALYNNGLSTYANTFSYTINSANTWEQKTVTITGATGSTWNTTNGASISVSFSVGMGSTYQTASGSWGSTTGRSVSGAVNVVSTNAATWQVTGVQLEIGTAATPFEQRLYTTELQFCQRYYYKLSGGNYFAAPINTTDLYRRFVVQYKTSMRANPTCTVTASVSGSFAPGNPQVEVANTEMAACNFDVQTTSAYANLTSFTASAEL